MGDDKLIIRKKIAVKFAEMICKHHSLDLDPRSATFVSGEPDNHMGIHLNLENPCFCFDGKTLPFPKHLVDDYPEFILDNRMNSHIRLRDLHELKGIIDTFHA